jgi:hypothetical protein
LLLALLMALTISLTLFFSTSRTGIANANRQQITEKSLAQAKQAVIAWSVLQGDIGSSPSTRRPGTLPCPDIDNSGVQTASCSAAGGTSIGRLPSKTLGIEDLRDADGERLWYALSNNFRRASGLNNKAINSDTQGTLQLYAADGTTLLTPAGEELAAIIFSAGSPLAGQDRLANANNAANYLDAAYARNNASAAGPFISGPAKSIEGETLVNDRAIAISARELISAIEKRALREAQNALAAFAMANGGKYPNPAKADTPSCMSAINDIGNYQFCPGDNNVCFGRLPENSLAPYTPLWFKQNGWGRVMSYAVNQNRALDPSAPECTISLTVDAQSRRYVLLAPGSQKNGQTRPAPSLSSYFEDAANYDAWTSSSIGQPTFSTPSAASNDQLRSLP